MPNRYVETDSEFLTRIRPFVVRGAELLQVENAELSIDDVTRYDKVVRALQQHETRQRLLNGA